MLLLVYFHSFKLTQPNVLLDALYIFRNTFCWNILSITLIRLLSSCSCCLSYFPFASYCSIFMIEKLVWVEHSHTPSQIIGYSYILYHHDVSKHPSKKVSSFGNTHLSFTPPIALFIQHNLNVLAYLSQENKHNCVSLVGDNLVHVSHNNRLVVLLAHVMHALQFF